MKKAMVMAVAVTLVAAIANGATVQFYDLGTSSIDGTLSSDGKYVGGSVIGPVTYRTPAYWTADLAGGTAPVRSDLDTWNNAGYVGGISASSNGTLYAAVNAGSTTYAANNFIGMVGTVGGSRIVLPDPNGVTSNANVNSNNCAEAAADGSGVYVAGLWSTGSSNKGNDGLVWKWDGTAATLIGRVNTGVSGKVTMRAVASNGTAVGRDKGGMSPAGGTAKDRAIYTTLASPNTAQYVPMFAGNASSTQGDAYDISPDGQWIGGLMYQFPDGTNYKGFRYKMGDANSTPLNKVPGAVSGTVAVAYAIAQDGAAVGMSYIDDSNMPGGLGIVPPATTTGAHNTGTIWFPGQADGVRVIDVLINQGIYNSSIRHIDRTYGIASLGGGQYALSGEGSFWTNAEHTTYETRAWYAVVPEPATALFVAFGGLALLRRRR